MNKYLMLPLAALMLTASSCHSIREDLVQMPEDRYNEIATTVNIASRLAGARITRDMGASEKAAFVKTVNSIWDSVRDNEVESTDLMEYVVGELGLSPIDEEQVRLAVQLIALSIGRIDVGVENILTPRELGLVAALLSGLATGAAL